jgi:16S rRNA (cytidine1402-2'-O)-methyltransferase
MQSAGILYIVATPIGNLQDISSRAIETLKAVDLIAAEDTRHTGVLLKHYGISTKQLAYHQFNEKRVTAYFIEQLTAGKNIAVVSDAGTPGIADAGFLLVREAIKNEIQVVAIPGASSILAALVISGLPCDRFIFEGFLPKTSGRLDTTLIALRESSRTMVFLESPHRITKALTAMLNAFGDRRAFVGRELTKKFEQSYRGNLSELLAYFTENTVKGEIVIVVAGKDEERGSKRDKYDRKF